MTECKVSIDVECAAVGRGHFDVRPCRIAMVDYNGKVLFDEISQVPGITDPLIEFTGLTKEEINNGKPLKEVLAKLHQKLMEFQQKYQDGVTIIGQAPQNDIVWCKLEKSKHYSKVIDLAEIFKTGKWYYSLRRVAYALLGDTGSMNKQYHDPTEDAKVSMILYREYQGGGSKLHRAKRRLASMGKNYKFPDFRVRTKYKMCSGMYDPKRCTCGQSSARGVDGVDELRELLAKFNLKNEQNEEEKSNDVQNNISG